VRRIMAEPSHAQRTAYTLRVPASCDARRSPNTNTGMTNKNICAALIVLSLWAVGCSLCQGTEIQIQNRSAAEITDIKLTGSGFSFSFPRIAAGGEIATFVFPKGESGLAVSFRAGGELHQNAEQGHFDVGYEVHVVIAEDLRVTVEPRISGRIGQAGVPLPRPPHHRACGSAPSGSPSRDRRSFLSSRYS